MNKQDFDSSLRNGIMQSSSKRAMDPPNEQFSSSRVHEAALTFRFCENACRGPIEGKVDR